MNGLFSEYRPYRSTDPSSGIDAYQTGTDYVKLRLKDGRIYKFSYRSAGRERVEKMKLLAQNGSGLDDYYERLRKKEVR